MPRRDHAADLLRPVRRALRDAEVAQVERFGRSLLSVLFRTPVLVLVTTGRRTGRQRRTALAHLRLDDGDLLVVGGAGGQRRVPDWVANLRAEPRAVVVVDRVGRAVVARELEGDERARAWDLARRAWPRVDVYERRAGRPVPVFRLRETMPG